MEREFDVIVIGAGPAGEVCAGRLGERGSQVAIVERHLVGGECSYYGCMPSKALLRPAQVLSEAARIPGAAEAIRGGVDAAATLARRDEIVHDLQDDAQLPWLEGRGITLVRGTARLVGEREVEVDGERLVARKAVVIAAGTEAAVPPIPGLREAKPWTNREATVAKEVPATLTVIGGGPIGVELGQAFASLGSTVTVIEGAPRILGPSEPWAAEMVREGLEKSGVTVHEGAKIAGVVGGPGDYAVTVDGIHEPIESEQLLVAAGRAPLTHELGLETVGLEPGRYIDVDEQLRVPSAPWLYAIGDVNRVALLTHEGKYQGRVAADHILGLEDARLQSPAGSPPYVVFTEPQVAAVGHTEASAAKADLKVITTDHEISSVAGASFMGRSEAGRAQLVIDANTRVVVGATFAGPDVADMLHAATIAVSAQLTVEQLMLAVPTFPTRSEVWLRMLEKMGL